MDLCMLVLRAEVIYHAPRPFSSPRKKFPQSPQDAPRHPPANGGGAEAAGATESWGSVGSVEKFSGSQAKLIQNFWRQHAEKNLVKKIRQAKSVRRVETWRARMTETY